MRCIYVNNKMSYLEAISRKLFIEEVFGIKVYMTFYTNYLLFESKKTFMKNVLIICGHNNKVYEFLINNTISEKKIYMISCYTFPLDRLKLKNKRLYISLNDNCVTKIYDGKFFNFNFDLTETELILYNYRNYDNNLKLSKSFLEI